MQSMWLLIIDFSANLSDMTKVLGGIASTAVLKSGISLWVV